MSMYLIRVVRMTFQEDQIDTFLRLFDETKERIRHFEGCQHLELWQDHSQPHVFTTYSHWASDDALQGYRQSELFAGVWKQTKALFADKPQAYSFLQARKVD